MTESEWKHALDCATERLSIAVALFHKLELDAVGDIEAANHWEMVQELLIGKRDESFAEIRERLFLDDPERRLAEVRVREWLKQRVIELRKPKAA